MYWINLVPSFSSAMCTVQIWVNPPLRTDYSVQLQSQCKTPWVVTVVAVKNKCWNINEKQKIFTVRQNNYFVNDLLLQFFSKLWSWCHNGNYNNPPKAASIGYQSYWLTIVLFVVSFIYFRMRVLQCKFSSHCIHTQDSPVHLRWLL